MCPTSGSDIYTTGYSYQVVNATTTEFLTVAAFNSSAGTLTSSFTPAQNGIGDTVAVLPKGNIVIAGQVAGQSFLAQYSPAGVPTPGFNPPSLAGPSSTDAVAYQPEGGVLVAAGTREVEPPRRWSLPSTTRCRGPQQPFGGGSGVTSIPFPGASSLAAVSVQPDGKAVVAGNAPGHQQLP